uniref:WAP domain-containing protein n=1 Tax=Plectus sambesii TaxID=2011161 RepID=A0A914XL72_9BILA
MIAFSSSLLVIALIATQNVLGQQQAMMGGGGSRQYCRPNDIVVSYCSYNGICPVGAYCTSAGYCCAYNTVTNPPPTTACPAGRAELGPCLNSGCQSGAQCYNNRCCSFCPVSFSNIGPCVSGGRCPPPATCQNGMCCLANNGR